LKLHSEENTTDEEEGKDQSGSSDSSEFVKSLQSGLEDGLLESFGIDSEGNFESIGRELGEQIGRLLGETVGQELDERIRQATEDSGESTDEDESNEENSDGNGSLSFAR
jgi:predicted hydrocarbon binding protein